MRGVRRIALVGGALALGCLATRADHDNERARTPAVTATPAAPRTAEPETHESACSERSLTLPSGAPPRLSCSDARKIVAQVRARLAEPQSAPHDARFGESVMTWFDPHGLWSAAPDAPLKRQIPELASTLAAELERSPHDPSACTTALRLGRIARDWVDELRQIYVAAERGAPRVELGAAFERVASEAFEDDPVTRRARSLTRDLGRRGGLLARSFGSEGSLAAQNARERLLPSMTVEQWSTVVLAAAVRAYVPSIDVHGQWAPLDEEWSLYAADSVIGATPRLWERMVRTLAGVRILEQPAPPLQVGDVVIQVGGVATAGLSVEQAEQLSVLESIGGETQRDVVVLRRGEPSALRFAVPLDVTPAEPAGAEPMLQTSWLPYGDREVLVVNVPDVPDWLGEALSDLVAKTVAERRPAGILLDLRGNGGGSTDGAAGALGVFLPGVPSFPLRHRDGHVEVEHAETPPAAGQWSGPVAALVDGYTASAAEMIAGAIGSYRRGPVLGTRTFGKGCIQEYFDDRAGAGVLRLTTMMFALPDGSPVQGVGVSPDIPLNLPVTKEREAALPGALGAWRGPDVRSAQPGTEADIAAWPEHGGRLGSCLDPVVCSALRRLGAAVPAKGPGRGTAKLRVASRGRAQ